MRMYNLVFGFAGRWEMLPLGSTNRIFISIMYSIFLFQFTVKIFQFMALDFWMCGKEIGSFFALRSWLCQKLIHSKKNACKEINLKVHSSSKLNELALKQSRVCMRIDVQAPEQFEIVQLNFFQAYHLQSEYRTMNATPNIIHTAWINCSYF